jgi:divalent metal cation (Fe/Co/Zn/Cd) transporter
MLAITATASFIIGWRQFHEPDHLQKLFLSFIVLTIAICTNGYALWLCIKKLRSEHPGKSIRAAYVASTSVEIKTTFALDMVGAAMAAIGLVSLLLVHFTGNHALDGLGAMIMAALLAIMAIGLLFNVRDLIVGRSAGEETESVIRQAVADSGEVKDIIDLRTMILGNNVVLVNLNVKMQPEAADVAKAIDRLQVGITSSLHGKAYIQIQPE